MDNASDVSGPLLELSVQLLVLVATAALGFLARWLSARGVWADRDAKARDLELLESVARMAVAAAEEIGRSRGLKGRAKYDQAVSNVATFAGRYGLTWTPAEIDAAIHDVVMALQSEYQKVREADVVVADATGQAAADAPGSPESVAAAPYARI